MLEKTTRVNYLFDFYQELLTPKQRNYMEMYYLEDLSLGEISESFDVSRQAVFDNIRRTEAMLEDYEEKLKLYDRFRRRKSLILEMKKLISQSSPDIQKMKELLDQIENLE
ncbi:putative DNA-binding protein [Bacillaceae bacterium S4-13-58]